MLSAVLGVAGPLLVAGWASAALRRRRLILRELRNRYYQVEDLSLRLFSRLDAMEDGARIAHLAPVAVGQKPSDAREALIALRDEGREAERALANAEGLWEQGQFRVAAGDLMEAWARLDGLLGGAEILKARLNAERALIPDDIATAALEQIHQDELARLLPQDTEIRARIEKEVPRLLERLRTGSEGLLAGDRILAVERLMLVANEALAAGDLIVADAHVRRARQLTLRIGRLFELGVLPADRSGLPPGIAAFFKTCDDASLPPRVTFTGILIGLVLAGFAGSTLGDRIEGSTVEIRQSTGNVALKRPVRVSSALDVAHDGMRAVDGDLDTAWMSGESLSGFQALVVNLGKPLLVQKVAVLPLAAPPGRCTWEIDVSSDGLEWIRVGAGKARGSAIKPLWGQTRIAHPQDARFVRVRPLDWGRSGVGIFELRVFGQATARRRKANSRASPQ